VALGKGKNGQRIDRRLEMGAFSPRLRRKIVFKRFGFKKAEVKPTKKCKNFSPGAAARGVMSLFSLPFLGVQKIPPKSKSTTEGNGTIVFER